MRTFRIQTLGCRVNHYESEQVATVLRGCGLVQVETGDADLRIINTCSVTVDAASKSRQSLRRAARASEQSSVQTPAEDCSSGGSTPLGVSQGRSMSLPVLSLTGAVAGRSSATASSIIAESRANSAIADGSPSLCAPAGKSSAASRVLAIGCWATSNPADAAAIAGVDAVLTHHDDIAEKLDLLLSQWGVKPLPAKDDSRHKNRTWNGALVKQNPAVLSGNIGANTLPILGQRQAAHQRAFLKIQDGCDAHCTYCIIPSLRPKLWSKPIDLAIDEARRLVDAGHREIVLTGIFLGAYGQTTALRRRQGKVAGVDEAERAGAVEQIGAGDRSDAPSLPIARLIDALCTRVPGLHRLRLSSLEPGDFTQDLVAALRSHPQVVPHFHLPLQSGSSHLLRRMNRQYTRDDYLAMVDRVYENFDRPAITTDIIAGFPGETDEEFQRTMDVVEKARFIHIHAFPFSPRPGTAAARWSKDFVRGPIVGERIQILQKKSIDFSYEFRRQFVGEIVELLVEREPSPAQFSCVARDGRPDASTARKIASVEDAIAGATVANDDHRADSAAGRASQATRLNKVVSCDSLVDDESSGSLDAHLRHGRCERYFDVHFESDETLAGDLVTVRIDRVTPTRTFGALISNQASEKSSSRQFSTSSITGRIDS
jgi:MiaB/RimO family radical SAM methylthiotransferase